MSRPLLKDRASALRKSLSKKKRYTVPKKGSATFSRRRDEEIAALFQAQYDRGVFEANLVNIVSRVEAFFQECVTVAVLAYPEKLSVMWRPSVSLSNSFTVI